MANSKTSSKLVSVAVLTATAALAFSGCALVTDALTAAGAVEPTRFVYMVRGSSTEAFVTYSNPSGGMQQAETSLPLKDSKGKRGVTGTASSGTYLYLSAQNLEDSGTVTCSIIVGGETVNTNTSRGGYAIATCEYLVP